MKYVNSCGTLCVLSSEGAEFVNFMSAVMAMNAIQLFYAHFGYSVHTDICEPTKLVEVRVHFDSFSVPALPAGYLFSRREISSQPYTVQHAKTCERVRVLTYWFKF